MHLGGIVLVTAVVIGGSTVAAGATSSCRVGSRHRGEVVTSVNGVSAKGTCGVAGVAGSFTVVGKRLRIVPVYVTTSPTATTFIDSSDPSPSFGDVCVGNYVKIIGTGSSGTVTASSVAVLPPNVGHLKGVVTSVNGASATGSCGTSGDAGTFTVVGRRLRIVTVGVTTGSPATAFTDSADPSPSFADVCVGVQVEGFGTFSGGSFTASAITVLAAPPSRTVGVVTSVNGVSTAGTCGVSDSAGEFTVVGDWRNGILTVEVTTGTGATTFIDSSDTSPSFQDICVGVDVGAAGTSSAGTLTATQVTVLPPGSGGGSGDSGGGGSGGGGSGGGKHHHHHGGH